MNGNGVAAQRKAVEDYLNGCRWKLVGEFTEVESGKRAVAGTCMDNLRATVPFSEVKDAVEGARLKAIWRCLLREHLTLSRGTEPWPVMRFCVAPRPTRA